jgi:hypothetical protein
MAGQSGMDADFYLERWFYTAITRASQHVTVMEAP